MLNIYARSFLEATRSSPVSHADQRPNRHLDEQSAKRERHARLWLRRPYWL